MSRAELIAGLDIGTTKTCCIVGEALETGELMIIGLGVVPSGGIKRGVVVDLEATTRSIEDAVHRASSQCGREVGSVFVGVTGEHISSLNSRGVTAVSHPNREINDDDVERALQQSRVIVIPPDRIILHAIPRSYSIDGQNGIRHPVGMSGTRLEVETHIVTGAQTFLQNVEKCVSRAGLGLRDMVLEPLATSEAVLSVPERSLGVALVDIGGGTTDVAVFGDGEIAYSAVIPVGGAHVTTDLATLLRITVEDAEGIKIRHGCAISKGIPETEGVPIKPIGASTARPLKKRAMCEIVEARMQELFGLVKKELMKSGCYDRLAAGIVLTGGGSQLGSIRDCATSVLQMPVRLGMPSDHRGLGESVSSPCFSTAVGLIHYGLQHSLAKRRQPAGDLLGGAARLLGKVAGRFRPH